MTHIERRLCLAGLALFLLALLQGFAIPAFVRLDVARAAHATALGSGTFLIAVGLLWPKLSFRRLAPMWAGLLAISLYAIAAGLMLSATYAAGSEAMNRAASVLTLALTIGGSIALVVSLGAVILVANHPFHKREKHVPTASRIQEFVDCVCSNEHVKAIEMFYHADATMQENLTPPRGPRAALMEAERRMLAAHKGVVTSLIAPVFINGDEVVLHWIFEFTRPDDTVMRVEELAHQTWRGDRIASERFYSDPAQMRA